MDLLAFLNRGCVQHYSFNIFQDNIRLNCYLK